MTSAALDQVSSALQRAGLARRVIVAEATVDPWRDSPKRLRAYRRLTDSHFALLTGSQGELRALWKFFGVFYRRVPERRPADVDWMTHRRERFDVEHTDGFFVIDPRGQERILAVGMPSVGGELPAALHSLLSTEGVNNLAHPELPWTPDEVLDDLYFLMDRNVPAGSLPRVAAPSTAAARQALRASPTALAALHRQGGELLGSEASLNNQVTRLRGYPVVVNVWASWCPACRAEFSTFAVASAEFGRKVAFLGVDNNDAGESARHFLAKHPVSYPSYQSSPAQLARFGVMEGMPTTFFLDRAGRVVGMHVGPYQTTAALDNDIEHYALGVRG